MNILLDGLQIGNRSGTGAYARALAQEIPSLADDVKMTVVVSEDGSKDIQEGKNRTIEITKNTGKGRQRKKHGALFKRLLKNDPPQIVHFPATFSMLRKPLKTNDTTVVLTIHDLAFLRNPKWFRWERSRYYRSAIKQSISVADSFITDSQATAWDLEKLLNIPADAIHIVPLGVSETLTPADDDLIISIREQHHLPDKYYLYLGTLEPRKNIDSIIRAFSAIADKTDWDLVIAGRDGWKTGALYKAAKKSAHRDRIHFTGFIKSDEVPAMLTSAQAFVWPSLMEGFGLPPLEAMACGTPVLTSNLSSLPETVGDAAIKVDPYSTTDIAKYMLALSEDEGMRKRLTMAGLNRVRQFHWRQCAQKTYAVYQNVLKDD